MRAAITRRQKRIVCAAAGKSAPDLMPAGNFIWSNQITFLAVTNSFQSGSGRENTVSSMHNDDSQNRKKPVFDRSQKQVSSPGDGYKKDAVVAGLHQKPNRNQQSGCGLERSRGRSDIRGDMSCVDKKCTLIRAWD